jgi:DNA-binding Lrp family transcriptional regulator
VTAHARTTDPITSHLAAERRDKVSHRQRILTALEGLGYGTYQDIAEAAQMQPWECTRRISDLVQDGDVIVVGHRPLTSGRLGQVYAVTP